MEEFEVWYNENDNWESIENLRPVRTALVGLGVDESAHRMADWLSTKGVAIDLLTSRGFRDGNRMLLARQLESSEEATRKKSGSRSRLSRTEKNERRRKALETEVDKHGIRDWWSDAVSVLEHNSKPSYRDAPAISFYRSRKRRLSTGQTAHGSHKIEIAEPGTIRIVFFPAAVELCLKKFDDLREVIPFDVEQPRNAPVTGKVSEQYFCRLDKSGWDEHKVKIATLLREVDERWREDTE